MRAKSILIVEDNRQDELLMLRALKRTALDCEVDVVRDGQQALDYLYCEGEFSGRSNVLPTVVLLDLSLPRVGGLNVLERLRADMRTQLLPICVLTSSDEECDRQRAYQNGANSYVRKPLDFEQFADTIARLVHYWLVINESTSSFATEDTP